MTAKAYLFKVVTQAFGLFLTLACSGSYAQLVALASPTATATAKSIAVEGVGASFPSKVYTRWANTFEQEAGIPVNYKPTGSGDGVKQIISRSVSFSGSDTPLPADELLKHKLVQVPMLVGGIVPVVNLPGVMDKRLQLSGELLAAIMSGRVRQWSDPLIRELNPSLKLPAIPINRIVRSDKSGTTHGFTRYLSAVSESFKNEVGISQLPKWTGTFQEAEGNDGVITAMNARAGSITYVSFDRTQQGGLSTVLMRNAAGNFVGASEEGFRSAIIESDMAKLSDDQASIMDQPGLFSWPITMTSFVLFPATPENSAEASRTLKFLYWCFLHGDKRMRGTGFAPLPASLQSKMAARFRMVKPKDNIPPQYLLN